MESIFKLIVVMGIVLTSCAYAQDTVYVESTAPFIELRYGTTLNNIIPTQINCDTAIIYGQGSQIIVKSGQTEVQRFTTSNYIFKINGSVVSGTANIFTAINATNPGIQPSMKLIKTIKVVTAAPVPAEANTEYVISAQNSINITGLTGNTINDYMLSIFTINTGTTGSNSIVQMRFNGDAGTVYDYVRGAGGTTWSGTQLNSQTSFDIGIATLNNGYYVQTVSIRADTGVNRTYSSDGLRSNANGQQITSVYHCAGIWRNSVDELTSIQLIMSEANSRFGVGTEIKLFALLP